MLTSTAVQCTCMAHASKVLVYAGNGTAQHFVEDTILTFRRLLGDGYTVTKAYALDLASRAWMNSTSMLIIPGGRASPYAADLDGEANSNIIDYVKEGGCMLGLVLVRTTRLIGLSLKRGTPNMRLCVTCHWDSILEYVAELSSLASSTTLQKAQNHPILLPRGLGKHIQYTTMVEERLLIQITIPVLGSWQGTRMLKIQLPTPRWY
ncbi:biotin holocarboxylase synthetase [Entomophthora muscae]|uniref:Biotin holocarboxylase synthetase n=1 Tax=Entomophthora muscae TaxID=34485 RepID=A0ACC2SSD8_9FUNG|nr:biotin holocarboxylase synthetase [Entomophthora muscae]